MKNIRTQRIKTYMKTMNKKHIRINNNFFSSSKGQKLENFANFDLNFFLFLIEINRHHREFVCKIWAS